jgi:hypothetical protein
MRICRSFTENGHIESLNGRLRDECLNVQQFVDDKLSTETGQVHFTKPPGFDASGGRSTFEVTSGKRI